MKKILIGVFICLVIGVLGAYMFNSAKMTLAEQSGGSPESGVTSRIKTLYDNLVVLGFGSDIDNPDWGAYWNRIKTAASWVPNGAVGVANVLIGQTFYSNSRTQQTGTMPDNEGDNASTAQSAAGSVNYFTAPEGYYDGNDRISATDAQIATLVADLLGVNIKQGYTIFGVAGTYPAPSSCSTQQYHDSYGAPVTQTTNCTDTLTWTTPAPVVTGDDKQDPRTGLIWSKYLQNSAGAVVFADTSGSTWSWNGTTTFTVTAASATAGATYTNNGATFTVVTTISGGTSLNTTGTGAAAASGTLTKASGTGDATITFSAIANGGANAAVGGKTAIQICSERGDGWRLPSQKELMQVYIDGSYWNLTNPANYFWSATEVSATNAWFVNLSSGTTVISIKTIGIQVRCVR